MHCALADARVGLWEWDLAADRLTLDQTCREILGLPDRAWFSAAELPALHAPESVQTTASALQADGDFSAAVYTRESLHDLGDGDHAHILTHARLVECDPAGKPLRMIGTHRDVSAQREAEQGIMLAREEAERASRAKSEFLANMSHEIRTPLNAVTGMADLLLHTGLTPRQERYIGIIHGSATALVSLINDVLDFSKIEAGKLELENLDINLRDIIEDTVEMFSHRCDQKGVELISAVHADAGSPFKGDPVRLRQVLVNLINNAVKFTEHGSITVRAEIESSDADNTRIRVSVRDTGIGIPPDRLSCLFKSFSQADASTTRRFGGTGLGLAISKEIVSVMGGRIGVESAAGEGSTFWFSVSLRRGEPANALTLPGTLRGGRAVIVDDQAVNREILSELARHWGMVPVVFNSGSEALAGLSDMLTADGPPLICLLDMLMPSMDGVQLARAVRSLPECADLPIVILSSSTEEDSGASRARGIAQVLSKPIRHTRLFDAILSAISGASEHAARHRPPGGAHAATRPLNVLVAEDNDVNQLVVSEILHRLGHSSVLVSSGRLAVDAFAASDSGFDVILMDCQMPDMDGFEATLRIREHEQGRGKHIPIVALTASAVKGDRERCIDAGMDDYLTKPIQPHELAKALERIGSRLPPALTPPTAAPAPTHAASADDDLLDRNALVRRCMGNHALAQLLIKTCLDQARVLSAGLRDAACRNDLAALASAGHALKGSASNAGLTRVARAAAQVEALGRGVAAGSPTELVERVNAELESCRTALPHLLKALEPTAKGVAA